MACRITEELVRKRAEHNDGEISTLEELSLHQQDLERIEHLDRWCPNLKILYLQNNLIPRIENVSRLKDLRYLNLALNNVTKIENLGGCESLEKLDLTVNFVDNLLSVESLRDNRNLQELFLTGNPCTDYEGYRDYVVAALPQLMWLDGREIPRSERILATQRFAVLRQRIAEQQKVFADKKCETRQQVEGTPSNSGEPCVEGNRHLDDHTPYTPESRIKMHQQIAEQRKDKGSQPSSEAKKTRTFEKDGKMLNINEGKYEFHLTEDDDNNQYSLEVACPRFMDSSYIHCDVQPAYIRLTIKDKVLQLVLNDEVSPDNSSIKRSQTTGKLLVTMPKTTGVIRKAKVQQGVTCSAQALCAPRPSLNMDQLPTSPPLKVNPQPVSSTLKVSSQPTSSTLKVSSQPTSSTLKVSSQPTSSTLKVSSQPTSSTLKVSSQPTSSTLKVSSQPTSSTLKVNPQSTQCYVLSKENLTPEPDIDDDTVPPLI